MSFKAQETHDDETLAQYSDQDQASLSANSSEASLTMETNVTAASTTSENNGIHSTASEDGQVVLVEGSEMEYVGRCDCSSASDNHPHHRRRRRRRCNHENIVTDCDEISKLSISIRESAVSTRVISSEYHAASRDVMVSTGVDRNHTESCVNQKTSELQNSVEPHSVVDIALEHSCASDEVCFESSSNDDESNSGQSGGDNLDVNSNVLTDPSLLVPDVPVLGYECSSCSSDLSSTVMAHDKCSHVLFTADVEHSESTKYAAGPDKSYVEQKTDSNFVSSVRPMSPMDRKSRPVPLPRSNTFRIKSPSEVSTTVSSRNSIPVQYETCSSMQSKICQTLALGDECESTYTLPLGIDFSEIYVDHVEGWPKRTAEVPDYDDSYDVLIDSISTCSDGYNRVMNCEPETVPVTESDYDLLKDDIWEDVSDDYDGLMDCEPDILPAAGLPSDTKEPDLDGADAWNDMRDETYLQPTMASSPPVDIKRNPSQYVKSSSFGDISPVSPPLPPRTFLPRSRNQDQLFNCVPPPGSPSGAGYPVPVPRTSLKKQTESPVTSPVTLRNLPPPPAADSAPGPPVRSSSSPVFSENDHYWSLAEVTQRCLHCSYVSCAELSAVPPVMKRPPLRDDEYIPPSLQQPTMSMYLSMQRKHLLKGKSLSSSADEDDSSTSTLSELQYPFRLDPATWRLPEVTPEGIYVDDAGEKSDLYNEEPLYQTYHDIATARALVAQSSCFLFDDDDDQKENAYEDVYTTMKRVQEIINRRSVEDTLDDCGKLSETLCKLVDSCTGPNVMMWSENPRVIAKGIVDSMTPSEHRLQECLFEVITSETSYVKSLDIVLSHFMKSLGEDRSLISKQDLNHLFSNMNKIAEASRGMQQTLNRLWLDDVVLDAVPVCHTVETNLIQNVELYVCYCRNASFQERTLRQLKKQPDFAAALSALEHAPEAHSLTLQSFLILPMQHITRLPLLVDAILHQLDAQPDIQSSQDYAAVSRCLETLHTITKKCNESARDLENRELLNEISKNLVFKKVRTVPLVTGNRYLIKNGTLTHIESRHSKLLWSPTMTDTKQLYLYVFTDLLLITKKKKELYDVILQSPLSHVRAVELSQLDVEKRFPRGTPSDCNNMFLVTIWKETQTIEYIFACKQSSEMTRWIAAFSPVSTDDEDETLYDERNDFPQVHTVTRFIARERDELDLEEADVISVYQKSPDGWLEGERIRDGKRGWFPADHTMAIENLHVRRRNVCQQLRRKRSTASQNSVKPL